MAHFDDGQTLAFAGLGGLSALSCGGWPGAGGRAAALADLLERVAGRHRRSSGHQCRSLKLAVLSFALDHGAGRCDLGWTRSLDA